MSNPVTVQQDTLLEIPVSEIYWLEQTDVTAQQVKDMANSLLNITQIEPIVITPKDAKNDSNRSSQTQSPSKQPTTKQPSTYAPPQPSHRSVNKPHESTSTFFQSITPRPPRRSACPTGDSQNMISTS